MERRLTPRYVTPPMYHPISVRPLDKDRFGIHGHAYDISECGIQFELDEPFAPGTQLAMMIHLPGDVDPGPGRAVFAMGTIIWLADLDEPGPVRMAMSVSGFCRAGDKQRLQRYLTGGSLRLAA